MSKEADKTPTTRVWPVVVALVFICVLWGANFYYGVTLGREERGTFGDMFGAVNALFSGVAFVGVIYAIYLQRQELVIARKDIAYTKQIVDEQQKQLAIQNDGAKKQAFESTFFQLLKLFNETTSQIEITTSKKVVKKGIDAFVDFIEILSDLYLSEQEKVKKDLEYDKEVRIRSMTSAYKSFYYQHGVHLGRYLHTLLNIIEFVDESSIDRKKFYLGIISAQISSAEVTILLYVGLMHSDKYKRLFEKYGMLQNLNADTLVSHDFLFQYEETAFGPRLTLDDLRAMKNSEN